MNNDILGKKRELNGIPSESELGSDCTDCTAPAPHRVQTEDRAGEPLFSGSAEPQRVKRLSKDV